MMTNDDRLVKKCGVPRRYALMRLDDMVVDDSNRRQLRHVTKLCERLRAGDPADPVFAVLCGTTGNGKTRCATHMLQAALEGWDSNPGEMLPRFSRWPYFIRGSRVGDHRFERDDEPSRVRPFLFGASFLVIDDLGKIADYKGEREFIEMLIEQRFDDEASTVLTMNITPEQFGVRFADFLRQFDMVPFGDAPSMRRRS